MYNSINSYKYITTGATTLFGSTETQRVIVDSIQVNKTTTGTLTIKSGGGSGTTIGIIAIGALQGGYWQSIYGTEIEGFTIINSATEDITVFYRNI